jgi:hypothetical protein
MGASVAETDIDDDDDFGETHEINVTPFTGVSAMVDLDAMRPGSRRL